MISEKKEHELNNSIENEQMNNSMQAINSQETGHNIPRGFDIFLRHGVSENELRTLRLIYHLSYLHQNLLTNINNNNYSHRNIDMSVQSMYQREENWLRAQLNNLNRRRNVINPENRTLSLNTNNRNRFRGREHFRRRRREPNINFLRGFILGAILNCFTLIFLLFGRERLKFKLGLLFGMIFSFFISFFYMSSIIK